MPGISPEEVPWLGGHMAAVAQQSALNDFSRLLITTTGYTAGADVFPTPLTARGSTPLIRVSFNLNTDAVLTIVETFNSIVVSHVANAGAVVTAGQTGNFDLPAIPGATYQVTLGANQAASAWRALMTNIKFA